MDTTVARAPGQDLADDGELLLGMTATTQYDLIERRDRYVRNGLVVDILGCHDAQTVNTCEDQAKEVTRSRPQVAEVVESFYTTLLMNMWTGERLICLAPWLTFNKQFMAGVESETSQEMLENKWQPYGFQLLEGPLHRDMPV